MASSAPGHARTARRRNRTSRQSNSTARARPDLHELIRKYGTYRDITPEAWAQYDADVERWKADMRAGVKWDEP